MQGQTEGQAKGQTEGQTEACCVRLLQTVAPNRRCAGIIGINQNSLKSFLNGGWVLGWIGRIWGFSTGL